MIGGMCNCFTHMSYHIFYKKLAGQNDSGLPFNGVKTYIVGIRNDLYHREFYFPEARYDKNDIDEKGYLFKKMWTHGTEALKKLRIMYLKKNRSGRCKLGFFIAWNGVTGKFNEELLRFTRGEEVVVRLTKEGIITAVKTGTITKYLQDEYSKALLR